MRSASPFEKETSLPVKILPGSLTVAGVAIVLAAVRHIAPDQIPAALVAAATVAILERFPIYLNPEGELSLSPVITLAVLALFGWPAAVLGSAAGIASGLATRPTRAVVNRGTEDMSSLAAAAAAIALIPASGPLRDLMAVAVGALAYGVLRTLIAAARLHVDEAMAWPRALWFLSLATGAHLAAVAGVTLLAVWAGSSTATPLNRLLVPVVAAAVTLQLYLPRILRGQQERRVVDAVSVLAAAVDARDPYTANHAAEVAELCRRVARILNLEESEVHRIYLGGLLHDVGKIAIPPEILQKPGKLTEDEWRVMKTHVEEGTRIIEGIRGLEHVAPLVACSHEHMDGSGYPHGLKGEEIPLGARINLAVDAYNALTTDRPYRRARSPEAALRELEAHAGTQFDPQVVAALRVALGMERPMARQPRRLPDWIVLLRRPAFALLWGGELVSFVGDNVFFVALTLWVLKLTGSATMLAVALMAATVGQGLVGLFAGGLADRLDRRSLIVLTDTCRAGLVALLPFLLPHSIPAGLALLIVLNVGTVFFRTAVLALIPSVVPRDDLATANALFQMTQRIAEVIGSTLGGAIVVTFGYHAAFYLDAASFLVGAGCVAAMPVAWRAGLGVAPPRGITVEIREGLQYLWRTPLHRILALLIFPGYLTLAFDALQAPMVRTTAGLSPVAYGVINSAIGAGKILSATVLTGMGKRWLSVPFVVGTFLLTSVATALFGATTLYPALLTAAFVFGVGNVATNIANTTLSLTNAPTAIAGRLMASRQVFISATTLAGMLVFGRLADVAGPPVALVALGLTSGAGVLAVWFAGGQELHRRARLDIAGAASPEPDPPAPAPPSVAVPASSSGTRGHRRKHR